MEEEFEVSLMDELNYFLNLQIKKMNLNTLISQMMYRLELLKKYNMENSKSIYLHRYDFKFVNQ